jgi:hypothetical protein
MNSYDTLISCPLADKNDLNHPEKISADHRHRRIPKHQVLWNSGAKQHQHHKFWSPRLQARKITLTMIDNQNKADSKAAPLGRYPQ